MKNLFISNLNEKDVNSFTTDTGLFLRRNFDKPFKKACNTFTKANIIRISQNHNLTNEEYFENLNTSKIPTYDYPLKPNENNIILERYPVLDKNESYIFVCNHTCPEDIETILNIIDRNAYLVLGSTESLRYNPEMYLLWLNGMIPFDILNEKERAELIPKMVRVLKTNSVAIFPEGSHNHDHNKIINTLYDGAVNTALITGKKIVVVTLVRDQDKNISYIDVANPVDVSNLKINIHDYYPFKPESEKYYVKSLTSYIRDLMATAQYYITLRHFSILVRKNFDDIGAYFRNLYIKDAFSKLKWNHDVFKAEYLVKKTLEDKEYEEIAHTLANIRYSKETLKNTMLNNRAWLLKEKDIINNDVANYMRNYWLEHYSDDKALKKRIKR